MCKECDEWYCSRCGSIQRGNHACDNCGDEAPVFECTMFNKDGEVDPDGNFDKNGKEWL